MGNPNKTKEQRLSTLGAMLTELESQQDRMEKGKAASAGILQEGPRRSPHENAMSTAKNLKRYLPYLEDTAPSEVEDGTQEIAKTKTASPNLPRKGHPDRKGCVHGSVPHLRQECSHASVPALMDPDVEMQIREHIQNSCRAPLPQLHRQHPINLNEAVPGAFAAAPGSYPQQRQMTSYSGVTATTSEEGREDPPSMASTDTNSSGLAVAEPVESALFEAQEVDTAGMERRAKKEEEKKRRWWLLIGCFLSAILLSAFFGYSLGYSRSGDTSTELVPAPTPSISPSGAPSFAPSGALDVLMDGLPNGTLASLASISTPQWRALDWLEHHPNLWDMPEWRKQQLFALATFFYAMGGEAWPEDIKERWLQYDREECLWFSGTFGAIREDGEYKIEASYTQHGIGDPCNKQDEFQNLVLFGLDLSEQNVALPPEIALLTSLSALSLPTNSINTSVAEFLPSEFHQLTNLKFINLYGNHLIGSIPTELGLMTSTTLLDLNENGLTGTVPSELGLMNNMERLLLWRNSLTGSLPSELGLMTSTTKLQFYSNILTGTIPRELGLLTNLVDLLAENNKLTGPLPSQLGSMTSMTMLYLHGNSLTGSIPTQWGLMSSIQSIVLLNNELSGSIPSQLALLSNMTVLSLVNNNLTGPISSQLGLFPSLKHLRLDGNAMTGAIPNELESMVANGSLVSLNIANNTLSGSVPEKLCSLGLFDPSARIGLAFDCGEQLCGCCWCPCPGSNYTGECQTHPFKPSEDDDKWPGDFPSSTNAIAINIHTDKYPEDTSMEWSILDESGTWKILDSQDAPNPNSVHSYQKQVGPNALYRMQLFDKYGDGTCCAHGWGWFTVTSSTPSSDSTQGSVLWDAVGDALKSSLNIYVLVDSNGNARQVANVTLDKQGLIKDVGIEGDNNTLSVIPNGNLSN